MRQFDLGLRAGGLLSAPVVSLLTAIHEHKGSQLVYAQSHADTLTSLLAVAQIQSTQSSNRIEGIHTTDARLRELLSQGTMPRNRDEREILGYRDVLATIHESFEHIPPRPGLILQLHRDLYRYEGSAQGGRYKQSDNSIEQIDEQGRRSLRFQPLSARETPEAMERLCQAYQQAVQQEQADPLLLIAIFVLDFLCIHPFHDGNGRMSRLLTLLLLYRAGFEVGKYISLERLIENTKDEYYAALQASSLGWHEGRNDYQPFVTYSLGIILAAYRDFSERAQMLTTRGMTAAQRVAQAMRQHTGRLTKREIHALLPMLSEGTIERALTELVKEGQLIKLGGGRGTSYSYDHQRRA